MAGNPAAAARQLFGTLGIERLRTMTSLKATRFRGEGNASRTVAVQLPLIAQTFPEIQHCHPGTINLELEAPLIIANPDHRTPPLQWKKSLNPGEVFDLLRIRLEIPFGKQSHCAWLYVAHRSAHRKSLLRHEIIAPLLNVDGVHEFGVLIRNRCIRLPYRHNPVYVV